MDEYTENKILIKIFMVEIFHTDEFLVPNVFDLQLFIYFSAMFYIFFITIVPLNEFNQVCM